jgi:hypothetical protein
VNVTVKVTSINPRDYTVPQQAHYYHARAVAQATLSVWIPQ